MIIFNNKNDFKKLKKIEGGGLKATFYPLEKDICVPTNRLLFPGKTYEILIKIWSCFSLQDEIEEIQPNTEG